jgi:hypothetical protein
MNLVYAFNFSEMNIWRSLATIKVPILGCKLQMAIKHFSEGLKSI